MSNKINWKDMSSIIKKLMQALRCDKCQKKLQNPHRFRKCIHAFCAQCSMLNAFSTKCFKCGVSGDAGDMILDTRLSEIFHCCEMLAAECGLSFDSLEPETELIQEIEEYSDESLDEMINNRKKKSRKSYPKRDLSEEYSTSKRKHTWEQMDSDVAQVDSDESPSALLDDVNNGKNQESLNNCEEVKMAKSRLEIEHSLDITIDDRSQAQFDNEQSMSEINNSNKENKTEMNIESPAKKFSRRKQKKSTIPLKSRQSAFVNYDTKRNVNENNPLESDVSQIESSEAREMINRNKKQTNKSTLHSDNIISRKQLSTPQKERKQLRGNNDNNKNDNRTEMEGSDDSLDELNDQRMSTKTKSPIIKRAEITKLNRSRSTKRKSKHIDSDISETDSDDSLREVINSRKGRSKGADKSLSEKNAKKPNGPGTSKEDANEILDDSISGSKSRKQTKAPEITADILLSDSNVLDKILKHNVDSTNELSERKDQTKKADQSDTEPSVSEAINFGARKIRRRQLKSSESINEIPCSTDANRKSPYEELDTEKTTSEVLGFNTKRGARQRINSSDSINEIASPGRRNKSGRKERQETQQSISEIIGVSPKRNKRNQIISSESMRDNTASEQKDAVTDLSMSESINFGSKKVRRQRIKSNESVNDADQSLDFTKKQFKDKVTGRRIDSENSEIDSDESTDTRKKLSKKETQKTIPDIPVIDMMDSRNEDGRKKLQLKQSLQKSTDEKGRTNKKARIDLNDSMDDMMDWINEINKKVESYPKLDHKGKKSKTVDEALNDEDVDLCSKKNPVTEKIDIDDEMLSETFNTVNYKSNTSCSDKSMTNINDKSTRAKEGKFMDVDDEMDAAQSNKEKLKNVSIQLERSANKKRGTNSKQEQTDTEQDDKTEKTRQTHKTSRMDLDESMDDTVNPKKETPKKSQICIERSSDKKRQMTKESLMQSQEALSLSISRKKESFKRASICLERSVEDILNRWKESSKKDQVNLSTKPSLNDTAQEDKHAAKTAQVRLDQSLEDLFEEAKLPRKKLGDDTYSNITYRKKEKPLKTVKNRETEKAKKRNETIKETLESDTEEKAQTSKVENIDLDEVMESGSEKSRSGTIGKRKPKKHELAETSSEEETRFFATRKSPRSKTKQISVKDSPTTRKSKRITNKFLKYSDDESSSNEETSKNVQAIIEKSPEKVTKSKAESAKKNKSILNSDDSDDDNFKSRKQASKKQTESIQNSPKISDKKKRTNKDAVKYQSDLSEMVMKQEDDENVVTRRKNRKVEDDISDEEIGKEDRESRRKMSNKQAGNKFENTKPSTSARKDNDEETDTSEEEMLKEYRKNVRKQMSTKQARNWFEEKNTTSMFAQKDEDEKTDTSDEEIFKEDTESRRKQISNKQTGNTLEKKKTTSISARKDKVDEEMDTSEEEMLKGYRENARKQMSTKQAGNRFEKKKTSMSAQKDKDEETDTSDEEIFKEEKESTTSKQSSSRKDNRKRKSIPAQEDNDLSNDEVKPKHRLTSTSSLEDEEELNKKKNKSSKKDLPKNVNKKNLKGESILHTACVKDDLDYAEALLRAGAEPNTKDHSDWTPLQEAAAYGNYKICALLLEYGALPNKPGYECKTPLHDAVNADDVRVVKLLLSHNANTNMVDKYGKTPEKYAKSKEVKEVLRSHVNVLDQTSDSLSNLNNTLNQTMGANDSNVVIYGSNLSSASRKALAELLKNYKIKVVTTFRPTVTHVVMDTDNFGYVPLNCDMLYSILGGKWLLSSDWFAMFEDCLNDFDPTLFEIVTRDIDYSSQRSRENAEKQNPPLFHNCHFYFALNPNETYEYASMQLTKQELCKLVKAGGGNVLSREPKPDDSQHSVTPFHVAQDPEHPLHKCSYFTIYMPHRKPEPRLKYNMKHLKCLPLIWFIESIAKFSLLDPAIFGLTEDEEI